MRVYAETNFLLELAYRQPEHGACEALLAAAEAGDGRLDLRVPSVCLAEASASIVRRLAVRRAALTPLRREERQIERSDRPGVDAFKQDLADLGERLIEFADLDAKGLGTCRSRLLDAGCVIPAGRAAAATAESLLLPAGEGGYGPFDALIVASVLADLAADPTAEAVFVTADDRLRRHPQIAAAADDAGLGFRGRFADIARQALGADLAPDTGAAGAPPPHTS